MPLSDEERARLFEEEAARLAIRREIDPPAPVKGFWRAMAEPENVRWLVASLMIPLATGVWGYFDNISHKDERQKQAELAEARRDVDQLTALIPSLVSDKPAERTIGLSVLGNLANARGAGPGIRAAYKQVQGALDAGGNSADPARREEAARDKESLIQGAATAATTDAGAVTSSAAAPASAAAPRAEAVALASPVVAGARPNYVYIQLYREADRAAAETLREGLRSAGVPVPGIENVVSTQGARVLARAQVGAVDVRYFRPADRDAALRVAADIGRLLPAFGTPTVKVVSGLKVRPGLVEVWFPCAATQAACRGSVG